MPRWNRVVGVILAAIAVASLASTAWMYPEQVAQVVGVHGLLLWCAWAVLWRPHVAIDDDGVTMVNILATHRIDFGAIDEVNTRWGLAITAGGRRYQAWAAPAPGTLHTMRINVENLQRLPESSYEQGTIRPGDDPATDSGAAALHIRRGLERHEGAGSAGVASHWHLVTIGAGIVCLIGTAWMLR